MAHYGGCPPQRPRRRRPRAEGLFKEEMEGGVTAALLPPINVSESAASKLRWGGINLGPHFPGSKRGHPRDISISMRTFPAGLGGQGSQVELIRLFSVSHHLLASSNDAKKWGIEMGGCNLGCPLKLAPPCLVETGSTEETSRLISDPASPTIKENVTWVQGRYNIARGRDKIWLPSNGLQHSPRLYTVPHERTGGMQPAPSSSSKKYIHILLQNIPLPPNSLKKPSCQCKRTYGPTCTRVSLARRVPRRIH